MPRPRHTRHFNDTRPARFPFLGALLAALVCCAAPAFGAKVFRAGAHAIDITPEILPVIVNGGFLESQASKINDRLHARCLVLDDGKMRLAIAVVDTCMMTRELIDEAKELAASATGIPIDRMLISATHTHSAPSAMACLGTQLDKDYAKWLPGKIAEGIALAAEKLAPARDRLDRRSTIGSKPIAGVGSRGRTKCRTTLSARKPCGP